MSRNKWRYARVPHNWNWRGRGGVAGEEPSKIFIPGDRKHLLSSAIRIVRMPGERLLGAGGPILTNRGSAYGRPGSRGDGVRGSRLSPCEKANLPFPLAIPQARDNVGNSWTRARVHVIGRGAGLSRSATRIISPSGHPPLKPQAPPPNLII
jgi:hypothetical protein